MKKIRKKIEREIADKMPLIFEILLWIEATMPILELLVKMLLKYLLTEI